MKLKVISISVLRTNSIPIAFLLRPGITVEAILDQLKVEDCVIFPATDPARIFDHKDELYPSVCNGERLIAAGLADASAAYRRSRAYHYPTQQYPIGDPQ
jgi:hypothetical protein